jgi:hypothetical protein
MSIFLLPSPIHTAVPTLSQAVAFCERANVEPSPKLDLIACCEAAELPSWDCEPLGDGAVILGATWLIERQTRWLSGRAPSRQMPYKGVCARWRIVNV